MTHQAVRHASQGSPGYSAAQRVLESLAMAAASALAGWSLWRLAQAVDTTFAAVVFAAVVCGWLLADLMSGLLHWAFDSWGTVRTPLLGKAFIRPFREHHGDPKSMLAHDFVELNGASCIACAPLLVASALMPLDTGWWVAAQALLLFTSLGATVTNQCHQWAHADAALTPRLVRWAQRHRLILSPAQHRLHHTPPFNSHFCTASGWGNAPFNAVLRKWR